MFWKTENQWKDIENMFFNSLSKMLSEMFPAKRPF